MGCNRDYTVFEATVIGAYNLGKLDKALLEVIMRPYADSDIDSGGCRDLKTKDGKLLEQVVIEVYGDIYPEAPDEHDFEDPDEFQEAQDQWSDEVYETFRRIQKNYGW